MRPLASFHGYRVSKVIPLGEHGTLPREELVVTIKSSVSPYLITVIADRRVSKEGVRTGSAYAHIEA